MDRALWLLLGLRLRGWARRTGRMLKTVKGAMLAIIGAVVFALMFVPMIVALFLPNDSRVGNPENIERYGVPMLLVYTALALSTSASEKAISFTPAEVNWLFPAPLSRRQLLIYKLMLVLLGGVSLAVFLGLPLRLYAHSTTAAIVGLFAAFMFLQLQGMIFALLAATAGAAFSRRYRLIAVAALAACVFVAVLGMGSGTWPASWGEAADAINNSPILRIVLAPLHWLVGTFAARNLWPDLVIYGGLALGFDLALVGFILLLDFAFLEASASASERNYNRLQLMRTGGMAALWSAGAKARFTLPTLPWWRGIGPIAWRQLLGLVRGLKGLTVFIIMVTAPSALPLFSSSAQNADNEFRVGLLVAPLSVLVFIAPSLLTFDFRGDIDRMDTLKSLPVPPSWLVIGQVAAPIVFMTVLELLVLSLAQLAYGGIGWLLVLAVAFAVPVNFVFIAMENLLFLLFPSRTAVGMQLDLQSMGRQMLYWFVKMIVLAIMGGFVVLCGWGVYALTDSLLSAYATAWVMLVGFAALLVLPLCGAFEDFDVSRDTPP